MSRMPLQTSRSSTRSWTSDKKQCYRPKRASSLKDHPAHPYCKHQNPHAPPWYGNQYWRTLVGLACHTSPPHVLFSILTAPFSHFRAPSKNYNYQHRLSPEKSPVFPVLEWQSQETGGRKGPLSGEPLLIQGATTDRRASLEGCKQANKLAPTPNSLTPLWGVLAQFHSLIMETVVGRSKITYTRFT